MIKFVDKSLNSDLLSIIEHLENNQKLNDTENELLYSLISNDLKNNNDLFFHKINDKYIIEILFQKSIYIKDGSQLLRNIIEKIDDIEKIKKITVSNPKFVKYINESFFNCLYNDEKSWEKILTIFNSDSLFELLKRCFDKQNIKTLNSNEQLLLLKNTKNICNSFNSSLFDDLVKEYLKSQEFIELLFSKESLNSISKYNTINETDEEFEQLMNEFKSLHYQNPNYREIYTIYYNSFNITYTKNPDLAKLSLRIIIDNIKKGILDREFLFEYNYCSIKNKEDKLLNTSYYSSIHHCIAFKMQSLSSETIMHETGHMIHDILDSSQIPNNDLESLMKKCVSNPDTTKKIGKVTNEYYKTYSECEKIINNKINEGGFNQIFNNLDFNKSLYILDISYEIKEFIRLNTGTKLQNRFPIIQKNNIIKTLTALYVDINYPYLGCISDILDAVYEGKYSEEYEVPGHGMDYYNNNNTNRFAEIFANYYALNSLCPDKTVILREILGNEFIEYMDNYIQRIINEYNDSMNFNKIN